MEIKGATQVRGEGKQIAVDGGEVFLSGSEALAGFIFTGSTLEITPGAQIDLSGATFNNVTLKFGDSFMLIASGARFTTFTDSVEAMIRTSRLEEQVHKLAEPFRTRAGILIVHAREAGLEFDEALKTLNNPSATAEMQLAALGKLENWSGSLYQGEDTRGIPMTKAQNLNFGTLSELAPRPEIPEIGFKLDGLLEALRIQAIQMAEYYRRTSPAGVKPQAED